jgi:hypothetical protein
LYLGIGARQQMQGNSCVSERSLMFLLNNHVYGFATAFTKNKKLCPRYHQVLSNVAKNYGEQN